MKIAFLDCSNLQEGEWLFGAYCIRFIENLPTWTCSLVPQVVIICPRKNWSF